MTWTTAALSYFASHAIDAAVAERIGVREQGGALVYPYVPREGTPFKRTRPLNSSHPSQPKGVRLAPWWPLPRPAEGGNPCPLITEGEGDALAALSASMNGNVDDRHVLHRQVTDIMAVPGVGFPVRRLVEELQTVGASEVVLALDNDGKSDDYIKQATAALQKAGIRVRRLWLPRGSDLAEWLAGQQDRTHALAEALLDAQVVAEVADAEPEDWPPLSTSALPAFPVDALPEAVGAWVTATAEATQTPVDLAACAALGVLSACVAGSRQVEVERGWREEVCLFVVCALESGERKSGVLRDATEHLREVERKQMEQARPEIAEAKARREAREQRRRKLMSDAARADDAAKREKGVSEAAKLAAELAAEPEPHVPRLLADDTTPEALAGLLARQGRIAIIAAESAFLDNLAGRYSEGRSNLHLVCQAYSGEPTTIDRRSREPEALQRPLLTMALCIQPHALAALVADPMARAQGFVARCLLAAPSTLLGHRKITPQEVQSTTTEAWAAVVKRLAKTPENRDRSDTSHQGRGDLSLVSRILSLSHEAQGLLTKVREEQEPRLREDGDLRPIADWQARHAGRVVRIAALLHLAAEEQGDQIGAATMQNALAIGEWSLAHALDALTGADPEVRRALAWLRRNDKAEVSLRDLQRGLHLLAEEVQPLADRLETHGALRPLEPPPVSKKGGRPASPRYAVHPDLRGTT